jgi:hypothetical protein
MIIYPGAMATLETFLDYTLSRLGIQATGNLMQSQSHGYECHECVQS